MHQLNNSGEKIHMGIACTHVLFLQVLARTIREVFDEPTIFHVHELRHLGDLVASKRPHVLLYVVAPSPVEVGRLVDEVMRLQRTTRVVVINLRPEDGVDLDLLRAGVAGILVDTSSVTELTSAIRSVRAGERYLPERLKRLVMDRYLHPDGEPEQILTPRELEICRYLARGATNREIAEQLYISVKTVDTHRGNLLRKLELRNNSDLTRFALRRGLIHLEH